MNRTAYRPYDRLIQLARFCLTTNSEMPFSFSVNQARQLRDEHKFILNSEI